ncbi:MAG: hypothetical protein IK016_05115, partial [Lachnospiraceae bacterium]|nr:hypothetical protein [Lachnospiraceae bacterium]
DGKVIYHTLDSPTDLYAYDLKNDDILELGSIPDYLMNSYSAVNIGGKLYTYFAVSDDGVMRNDLYEIDVAKHTISPRVSNQDVAPIIYLFEIPSGVLQLKTPKKDAGQTYFEIFEPQTGETHVVLVAQEREVFVLAATTDDSLFVLSANEVTEEEYEFLLKRFDLNTFQLLDTIDLEEIHSYMIRARIGRMEIFGDLIYFMNYSDEAVVIRISDNDVIPVLEEKDIGCAWNRKNETYDNEGVFFVRNTDECFILNSETGERTYIETELEKGYGIKSIFIDGDEILLYTVKPSNNKLVGDKVKMYLVDYLDFVHD